MVVSDMDDHRRRARGGGDKGCRRQGGLHRGRRSLQRAGRGPLRRRPKKAFGRVNVLYNNAGISPGDDDGVVNTPDEIWDLVLDINVKGVARCCRAGIPYLREAGGGSIINVASFVATVGAATPQIAYTASKGAVLSMTREIAVIHARERIRANALSPGPVRTALLEKFLSTEEKRQRRLVHVPMGRFGEPREIAQAALFLASDESSYITGADFRVDGGITAAYVTPEGQPR